MYKSVQVHGSALSVFMHNNVVRVSVNMLHTLAAGLVTIFLYPP